MGVFGQTEIFFYHETKRTDMEQLIVELVSTYPNYYNVMIFGYHLGYLEVRPKETNNDGSCRHDFDDLLKSIPITIMAHSLDNVKEIIAQYYYYMLTCSHFIIDNLPNKTLIERIDSHQIPYDQLTFKRHSSYTFERILFFTTEESAQAVKFLT